MGLKSRPTIPPGQDEAYLHMYKTFIGDARIVGICEYSAEFTTNQPMKTAEVLYGGYDVKIEGTPRGAQCNSLFMKGCKLMEKNVFSEPEWDAYAKENLVLVWLDFPKNAALVPEATLSSAAS